VVFFTELLKMLVSFCLETGSLGGPVLAARSVHHHMTMSFGELLKVSVPSLLYTVQNNLMFVSLNNLSAAVQQVTYQLKIVTTAVLSVVILGKALGPTKWLALMLLLMGVMLVQWPKDWGTNGSSYHAPGNPTIGFVAVLTACATSGLASVYLEKILKQTSASIWVRNVQLGFFGAVMALFGSLSTDGAKIMEGGFTQGYDFRVLCVIAMNACGGLLCAAVLKYADNILRCFSVALSIILTCVLSSAVLRDFAPDLFFITGAALAIASTFIYSLSPPPARPKAS
jgi:UDP-sugar transporter A1/2/3